MWNKISEKKPETAGEYLLKFNPGGYVVAEWKPDRNGFGYEDGDNYYTAGIGDNFVWMELPSIDPIYEKTKEVTYDREYYFKVAIPVKFTVKQRYDLYTDEFDNPYYEKDYDYDSMKLANEQNPFIEKIKEYLIENDCEIYEEGIE